MLYLNEEMVVRKSGVWALNNAGRHLKMNYGQKVQHHTGKNSLGKLYSHEPLTS